MELLKSQFASKEIIEKAYNNFKKAPKERLTKLQYIQCRIDALEDQWKLFLATHRKLVMVATDELLEEEYFTEDVYDTIEEVYINYNSDLKELLVALTPSSSNCNNYVQRQSSNECNIKLPEISIPIFSGNYSEWNTFRDLFISLVHQNTSIDNVQKMYYLKGLLSGEADQLLRHVPISSASYLEAWTILNKRYNNKKYLCNCLLKRFMNQPSVGSESCTAIKELLDTTTDTLNGLRNLGIDVSSWDVIVVYIVSSKLDIESRKQWESHINSSEELPSITRLKDFLEMRFRSLEFLDEKPNPKPKVLHTIPNVQQIKPCPFCKKTDHKISRCTHFTDLQFYARVDFVQENGLCFNCLGTSHYVKDCRYPPNCQICKQRHNSLLHFKPSTESLISDQRSEVAVGDDSAKSSKERKDQPVVSHFSKKTTANQILLATAQIEAQTKSGQVQLLRALLDQGSQASFITESAVQLLGLKRTPTKSKISGLGGDASSLSSKYIVTLNIKSRLDPKFVTQVRAYVLGAITSLPTEKVAKFNWPELEEIALADPDYYTPNKIDVLLGADVYGQVIREGLIKGPKSIPTAQNTALGWILSGPTQSKSDDQIRSHHCHHIITKLSTDINENELQKKFKQIESNSSESEIEEEELCEQFYNQDRDFQRLVWREDPASEIKENILVRLTFGTASAPHPAVKTRHQLAHVETENYSLVAERVKIDYIDDLITGCQIVEEGKQIIKEMTELVTKVGFDLQKWKKNSKDLAEDVTEGTQEGKLDIVKIDEVIKVLVLFWHIYTNSFQYSFLVQQAPITKRKVVSDIFHLLDPPGWALCAFTIKLMIQKLWLSKLLNEWLKYKKKPIEARTIHVPRWVDVRTDDACSSPYDTSSMVYTAFINIRTLKIERDRR